MQELTWIDWLWITYFVSAFVFLAENIREIYYRLKAEKQEKERKYNRTIPMTYGAMLWCFVSPFIPVINTIAAAMFTVEYIERKLMVLNQPVIKPYKGE